MAAVDVAETHEYTAWSRCRFHASKVGLAPQHHPRSPCGARTAVDHGRFDHVSTQRLGEPRGREVLDLGRERRRPAHFAPLMTGKIPLVRSRHRRTTCTRFPRRLHRVYARSAQDVDLTDQEDDRGDDN
jgi:hypothetical protein